MKQLFALTKDCPTPTSATWQSIFQFFGIVLIMLIFSTIFLWRRRWQRAQHAGNEAQKVAKNSVIPFILQLVTRALDFAFAWYALYPLLCKSVVGRYDFAGLVVVIYIGTLADWGLTIITTRDIARDPSQAPLYFRTMLRLRLVLALIALPLALLVPAFYYLLNQFGLTNDPVGLDYFLLMGLLALSLLPGGYAAAANALFQGHERLQIPSFLALLTNLSSTLLRIGALALGFGILGLAGAALIATFLSAGFFALALHYTFGLRNFSLRGPLLDWKPLLREGWPLMLNSLLLFVFFRFDGFIILPFAGEAALADYNTAYRYINLTQIIPPIVVNALFPLLSRRAVADPQAFRSAYTTTARWLFFLSFPLTVSIMIFADPMIKLLAGEAYRRDAAPALMILIWYLPLAYLNGLTQYSLIALGKANTITRAFGVTALFNLVANLLCVPWWGINAAAAITVASEVVLYLNYRRSLQAEMASPPLFSWIWRPATAAFCAGLIAWLLIPIHMLLALAAGSGFYLCLLFLLNGVTQEDRRLLLRMIKR